MKILQLLIYIFGIDYIECHYYDVLFKKMDCMGFKI